MPDPKLEQEVTLLHNAQLGVIGGEYENRHFG